MKYILLCITLLLTAHDTLAIGQLANVELYDRSTQQPLPVYWHQGRAYIEGKPGNEYQIAVCNQVGDKVLAVVSVDGVNVITGEAASPQQSGYIVDANQSLDIAGWRKSLMHTAAFYFTPLEDSYAARTNRPQNVGVIGVALYRHKISEMALAAPLAAKSANRYKSDAPPSLDSAEQSLGTGHGRSENSNASYGEFKRATPYPEESIEIFYDSYANLLARGVIPAKQWPVPQAFPGNFVPDPIR